MNMSVAVGQATIPHVSTVIPKACQGIDLPPEEVFIL